MKSQQQLKLFLPCILMLLFVKTQQATISAASYEDEENSSSAEQDDATSVEISVEVKQDEVRRKRSTDLSAADNEMGLDAKAAIPGLPDPATIIKIGQLLQTISDQVIPIIVEGITAPAEIVTQQFNKDFQLLRKFKKRLDIFNAQFKTI